MSRKGQQGAQREPKGSPNGPRVNRKGQQGAQREPKGSPNGAQREPKWSRKGSPNTSGKTAGKGAHPEGQKEAQGSPKGAKREPKWSLKGSPKSSGKTVGKGARPEGQKAAQRGSKGSPNRTSPSPLLRHGGRHTSSSLPFCSAAPSCVSPSGSCCTRNRIHICMSHRNTTRKVRTHMNTSGWRGSQMAQRTLAPAYDA